MTKMTSRERLIAAIEHREPDQVPIAPRMHLWSLEQYGDYSWLRQLALQEEFGTDPIFELTFRVPAYIRHPFAGDYCDLEQVSVEIDVENRGELNRVHRKIETPAGTLTDVIDLPHPRKQYGISPSPATREPLIKGSEDIDKIPFLFSDPSKVAGTNWRQIIELVGERGLVQVSPSPGIGAATMSSAMGMENAMVAFYQDRDLFDQLLEHFGQYHLLVTKAMLERGAPIIYNSWHDFGVSAGWSPKIYRAAFKPWVQATADLVHNYEAYYLYFDNGPIRPLLSDVAETDVDILLTLCPPPVGDVDLAEAKGQIGEHVCLLGNVDAIWVVQRGTPDQVREAVQEAIRVAGPGGGFILGNSDAFFTETPRENIEAFFDAAHEFGHYPIRL